MEQHHLKNKEGLDKLSKMVNDVKVCMFVTVQEDCSVVGRPMQTIQIDDEGHIWFFTNDYSGKVDDISKDNIVYLMYSHPGDNTYLQVKGECAVVTDKVTIEKHWSPIMKAWFPNGLEDPALALLRVSVSEASYWDGSSNKLVVFYNIVKAIVKGEKHEQGEFGTIEVNEEAKS